MINKKGAVIFGTNFVLAIALAVVFLILFAGGGVMTIFKISNFLRTIPAPVWIIFGVILIFKMIGGRR